jgi:hypothetical protein
VDEILSTTRDRKPVIHNDEKLFNLFVFLYKMKFCTWIEEQKKKRSKTFYNLNLIIYDSTPSFL